MDYEIVFLPKEEWKGTVVPIRYTTEEYFDLETVTQRNSFKVEMVKPFAPIHYFRKIIATSAKAMRSIVFNA